MDKYTRKKVQLAIILFLIFFIALLIISILFTARQEKKVSSINTDSKGEVHQKNSVTVLADITNEAIGSDIRLNAKVRIVERDSVDSWVIITILPEDKKNDPGLMIYRKTEGGYTKIIGPGTLFTIQQMRVASIPDTVIHHPITKRYISKRG